MSKSKIQIYNEIRTEFLELRMHFSHLFSCLFLPTNKISLRDIYLLIHFIWSSMSLIWFWAANNFKINNNTTVKINNIQLLKKLSKNKSRKTAARTHSLVEHFSIHDFFCFCHGGVLSRWNYCTVSSFCFVLLRQRHILTTTVLAVIIPVNERQTQKSF